MTRSLEVWIFWLAKDADPANRFDVAPSTSQKPSFSTVDTLGNWLAGVPEALPGRDSKTFGHVFEGERPAGKEGRLAGKLARTKTKPAIG